METIIKLTREQKIHVVIHAMKGPAIFVVGWMGAAGVLLLGLAVAILFTTEIFTDMLYWWAINKRPRSGSPDFAIRPLGPEHPPDPPKDVPRCEACGHPCPACELRMGWITKVAHSRGEWSGGGKE